MYETLHNRDSFQDPRRFPVKMDDGMNWIQIMKLLMARYLVPRQVAPRPIRHKDIEPVEETLS